MIELFYIDIGYCQVDTPFGRALGLPCHSPNEDKVISVMMRVVTNLTLPMVEKVSCLLTGKNAGGKEVNFVQDVVFSQPIVREFCFAPKQDFQDFENGPIMMGYIPAKEENVLLHGKAILQGS